MWSIKGTPPRLASTGVVLVQLQLRKVRLFIARLAAETRLLSRRATKSMPSRDGTNFANVEFAFAVRTNVRMRIGCKFAFARTAFAFAVRSEWLGIWSLQFNLPALVGLKSSHIWACNFLIEQIPVVGS